MARRGLSDKTEKPKDTKYVLKRLWNYLAKYKLMILGVVFLACFSNLFALIGPYLSGKAIDSISAETGVDIQSVIFYVLLMLIFYAASSCLSYLLSVVMIGLGRKVIYTMRRDTFHRLLDLGINYFDNHPAGDIISRLSYDLDTVNTSLSSDLVQIASSVITVIGALVMMLRISGLMTLVFLFTIPLSLCMIRFIAKRTRPLFQKRSAALGEFNGFAEEMITGNKTIKAYAAEEKIVEKFDRVNRDAAEAYYKADYYGAMAGPSMGFINNLSLSLISLFGAMLFLFKRISIGDISSFVLYSRKFAGPINEIANIVNELQSACAAAERVFRLIDEPCENQYDSVRDTDREIRFEGDVTASHIDFGYRPEKQIIFDLSFHAPKGGLVAVVGPTGAGKTTIINLLMRFYDVNDGKIQIDGTNIKDISRQELRKAYAMVLQDTWLFGGSFYENIAYAKPGASYEEVIRAAKAARIHDYIVSLPDGYDTILNEDGINISKGQKQLVTIARAMLCDAKMLILDEATSNVDTRTEHNISKAMRTLMQNKTCFVIAHRLSTIQNADLILVVNDGNIVEQGTHRELMKSKGFYYQMYISQYR